MATLTKAMLEDLNKGCATIKVIDIPSNPTTAADFDFSAADVFFTKDGSFQITQDEPSKTEQKLDQGGEIFDTDLEKGSFAMSGFIPSTAKAVFDYFFESEDDTKRSFKIEDGTTADYEGYGYSNELKQFNKAVAVLSQSKKTGLIFTNVQMYGVLGEQDKYRGVNFNGTILASTKEGIAAMYNITEA